MVIVHNASLADFNILALPLPNPLLKERDPISPHYEGEGWDGA